ncbi:DUF2497 domain-containing protein [Sphingomonas abietis]|uniref:DUF2497 domain-containing protein n=1 Tax=Sphingomonas abietis TaxID=3012344 RepID=A0ABY7NRP1_9SPHN|nr:DUF2497 domain-containing protein [Sphingomonas abietis]WBO24206.1 DUF2497 domain-containing protein [Sphingomonas abietis]
MEDILASIKRIIAEDSEAVGARAPRLRREAMAAVAASPVVGNPVVGSPVVMPLREVEPDIPSPVEDEAPEAVHEPETDAETIAEEEGDTPDVLELTSPMPQAVPAPVAAAEAPAASPAAAAPTAPAPDGLLSSTSAAASRSAFAALNQLQVRSDEGQSNTLEGLVSEMLRPMLREWLDRELPTLVERLVAAEVSRLSGRG